MPKKNPEVVAVDFDETIGFFKPKKGSNDVGGYITKEVTNHPNPRIVKFIAELRAKGIKVIVYSSRWWGDFNAVNEWLLKHSIFVDGVVLGRLKADAYICDKSIDAHDVDMEDKVYSMLKEKHSWGKFYKNLVKK